MGAELKYTDRDVRENPDFERLAQEYLRQYAGEFEYLIDMKMRDAQGMSLTVGMVRGVLNCMRHDPRVTGLPEPKPSEYGVVIDMEEERPRRQRGKRWFGGQDECNNSEPHDEHDYEMELNRRGEVYYYRCPGVYLINRGITDEDGYWSGDVAMPARIKVPFALARGGKLIHRVIPEQSFFVWSAIPHAWGYRRVRLSVKTLCQYPSYLWDPYLVGFAVTEEQAEILAWADRRKCPHCQVIWEANL